MFRFPLSVVLVALLSGGAALAKPPADARAVWLTSDRIAYKDGGDRSLALRTRAVAADGSEGAASDHVLVRAGVVDGDLARANPELAGHALFRVQDAVPATVRDWLKGELTVVTGNRALTGVQVGPVIDALYANDAALGVTFAGGAPTLRLWAPTATKVRLHLFDGPNGAESAVADMTVDPATGVWQAAGTPAWNRRYYLYEVQVFVPAEGRTVTNLVTDPYSLNLSADSQRSQIVDLRDADLKPAGWDALRRALPPAPEDRAIYELHVRDFSIGDASVPRARAGRYLGFADPASVGMRQLAELARAGLSDIHLLPTFDCATIPEVPSQRVVLPDLTHFGPANEMQQAAVTSVREKDGFNWCYDPWHFIAPEGSYSSDANTTARIVEFRRMVLALSGIGLGTILDQVFNHTAGVGQERNSVFDRIVPGYYYRLDDAGAVTRSSCCPNTASERAMMEKLMVDALITWARDYKVSGFRFDLMAHHSRATILKVRDRLRALTLQRDGVDGANLYLYGEGWNFGEVANDARFVQASQRHMGEGTGVGTFNDRFRDAIRGGGVSDRGAAKVAAQGFANGLFTAPNASTKADAAARARLLAYSDTIRVGLAGSLADYTLVTADGRTVKARDLRYGDGQVGYVSDPQETINYAEAHDNETLFDLNAFKLALDTSSADRVRWQNMAASLVILAQGVPFLHAGQEMLRSKSLDRNSHDSGDWFNALDYSMKDNRFARGLPPFNDNQDDWAIDRKLLTNPRLRVSATEILAASDHVREMLAIRQQTPAFRLRTEAEIIRRVHFPDAGAQQTPGVIVMTIDGAGGADVAVVFNGTSQAQNVQLAGGGYELHPIQQRSSDARLKEAMATDDGVTVPSLATAVFLRRRR